MQFILHHNITCYIIIFISSWMWNVVDCGKKKCLRDVRVNKYYSLYNLACVLC